MMKVLLSGIAVGLICCQGLCQMKKFYTVKSAITYDTIDFTMKATSGAYFIKPAHNEDPLTIYGNPNFSEVNPKFHHNIKGRTNFILLELEDYQKKGLSHAITYSMFGEDEKAETNYWKAFLTGQKTYKLNLMYGFGNADINLSNLAVSKFKISSGSADVQVSYDANQKNLCSMDTFAVYVDMGNLVIYKMNLARAKYVIADVGFGTAVLDFSEGINHKCKIVASIGAGKLKILIPKNTTPTIVNFKNSPLCSITLAEGFEKVDKDIFVHRGSSTQSESLLEFDIDVALGHVVFEYVK